MLSDISEFKVKQLEKFVTEHQELFGQKGNRIVQEFLSIFKTLDVDYRKTDRVLSETLTFAHKNFEQIGYPIATLIMELRNIALSRRK